MPVSIDLGYSGANRTPGIHLSGVLRAIATATGILKVDPDEEPLDNIIANTPHTQVGSNGKLMRLVIGLAWEEWAMKRIPDMIAHPGEFFLDDVIGSPDGISLHPVDGGYILHEFKATFKSSKKPLGDAQMWLWQAAGYLAMMSARYREACLRCVFHPLHIKGDYSGIDPLYPAQLVEFEQAEVDGIWNMVQQYKHLAIKEVGKETGYEKA